jgi:carbon-monoxide dehydrogenase large subunit
MNSSGAVANGIGQPVRRKEDFRLLTGRGSFRRRCPSATVGACRDRALATCPRKNCLRQQVGSARVYGCARRAHGPRLCRRWARAYTAWRRAHGAAGCGRAGSRLRADYDPRLPDAARSGPFVGEPVALVVAETIDQAKDAAEQLQIGYEPLPAVVRATDAIKPGAPRLWDNRPDNLCIDIEVGDEAATTAAFERAAHIVRLDTWVQRVTGVPMEPRTTTACYDAATGLYSGSGRGVAKLRLDLAQVLGVQAEQVRCVCGDMGGNFGTRNFFYPEYALLAWAARRVGRPVKWTCERSEAFISDCQGRDLTVEAELALDKEGNFLAVRGSNLSNLEAHAAAFVSLQKGLGLMSSVYRIPVGYFRGRGAVTNSVSTTPYRSAGRPEAIFVIERLIDLAADQLGFDPITLRRQNIIPSAAQPYANPLGITYDSGRYENAMDTARALADWDGFAARKAAAREHGKLRGIGIANYVEITSGAPRERTEITVLPEGRVELVMGTMSLGQGHTRPVSRSSSPNGLACRSRASLTSPTTLPGLPQVAARIPAGQ